MPILDLYLDVAGPGRLAIMRAADYSGKRLFPKERR